MKKWEYSCIRPKFFFSQIPFPTAPKRKCRKTSLLIGYRFWSLFLTQFTITKKSIFWVWILAAKLWNLKSFFLFWNIDLKLFFEVYCENCMTKKIFFKFSNSKFSNQKSNKRKIGIYWKIFFFIQFLQFLFKN